MIRIPIAPLWEQYFHFRGIPEIIVGLDVGSSKTGLVVLFRKLGKLCAHHVSEFKHNPEDNPSELFRELLGRLSTIKEGANQKVRIFVEAPWGEAVGKPYVGGDVARGRANDYLTAFSRTCPQASITRIDAVTWRSRVFDLPEVREKNLASNRKKAQFVARQLLGLPASSLDVYEAACIALYGVLTELES